MDLLPLPVIGWIAIVACTAAIGIGAWLIVALHLQGESMRRHLAANVVNDALLFGIWFLGLAGGIGLLLGKPWSRWMLELFCWALAALVAMSSYGRLKAAPAPRGRLFLGHLLFLIPVAAYCVATILTLRSETALKALAG